jgi:hypothetical protein
LAGQYKKARLTIVQMMEDQFAPCPKTDSFIELVIILSIKYQQLPLKSPLDRQ